ncbi:metal-dependent hydrolase [Clostridium saccharobutylicum]|uniref:Putative membrane-bound metal-dependent hydrolase n=1 Tax=Clostridium saccharobutylicum DSM 13864 TaxID=1345695 RepID=U5MR96_CLOSA|nr:metal-dependent hydrolase [Clostridium saccharobutylicum]AGX43125.1 putative membrane-bound metal-dependent hydrolase [Clostridium saccharobutylicum DSM 13864]AQR90422.1 inner membrane protein [Clostridium saccharobutylicum]AQS00328.1 inner membrane protein [Clostridium saccharobutylicum]AQS14311.1 inner membrane protein [Clostridium saccharobutylicum]MBA2907006.1 inner membrane protein [Clostridium saccharobutylicum]
MTGKTHMAIGACAATLMLPSNDIKIILGGTALSVVGSLIVDIDTPKSKGATFFKNLFGCTIILLILGLVVKEKFNINIFNYITQNTEFSKIIPALCILLILIVLGLKSPHRSFTHSIIGFILFAIPIYIMTGELYKWFAIGYIAHILADMLNKKEIKILYPLKKGIALSFCSADGIVDKLLFIGSVGIIVLAYASCISSLW